MPVLLCDHCGTAEATLIDADARLWCPPCFDQERVWAAGYAFATPPLSFNLQAVQRMLTGYAAVLHLPAEDRPYPLIALAEYEKKWAERLGIDISSA